MSSFMRYPHLFFDLDHTLWDFERNSRDTLTELHGDFQFEERFGFDAHTFLQTFERINHGLWAQYNVGQIGREEIRKQRFRRVFHALEVPEASQPQDLGEVYLSRCPLKPHCMPHTYELLEYLKGKGYRLHIITNGFADVQAIKMESAKLNPYFESVVTSETCGHKKPSPGIFEYALGQVGAETKESLMIGDNLDTDIAGAAAAQIDQVFYNPEAKSHQHSPTHEVKSLLELQDFL